MSFTTCPMQLQYPTRLRKQLKMFLAIVVNLMTHDINFNKISFINWSKMFILPKHGFYDLSYVITLSNTILKRTKNVFSN